MTAHRTELQVVVFNLTRSARDPPSPCRLRRARQVRHFALRSLLQSLGISLGSATEIDDPSTGKLMEGVLAAFAQFDNDVHSDRTRAGMKAALEIGRWVFLAPIGYVNAPRSMGKSLLHDPERAPLVRRAFKEYATGRFTKQQLLKEATARGLRNRRGQPLTSQAIGMLLRNQLYAGIVDVPDYGVRGGRGDFEPLITEDTFYRVQAVLSGRIPSTAPQVTGTPTSRFAASCAASRAAAASPAAGRRAARATTPTTLPPGCRIAERSPEVPLCERHARAGLQVTLEAKSSDFVGEPDHHVQNPGSLVRRVLALASVMRGETDLGVARDTGVVPRRVAHAPEDVDDTLRSRHAARECTWRAGPEKAGNPQVWCRTSQNLECLTVRVWLTQGSALAAFAWLQPAPDGGASSLGLPTVARLSKRPPSRRWRYGGQPSPTVT